MNTNNGILKIVYGLLGLIIVSFGIALYGGARMGIAPYDSLPLILKLRLKKLSYRLSRMIIDLLCTIIALVIGVLILKRTDIINFNTILTFFGNGANNFLFLVKSSVNIFIKRRSNHLIR